MNYGRVYRIITPRAVYGVVVRDGVVVDSGPVGFFLRGRRWFHVEGWARQEGFNVADLGEKKPPETRGV